MLITPETKKNIICWFVAVIAATAFILPMYYFTTWSLSNILLIPGALYLGYLALRWIARFGTFDVFAYQIRNWVSTFRQGTPKKYEDAYEYKQVMKEKRQDNKMTFIPWLIVGGVLMTLAIILSFFPTAGR